MICPNSNCGFVGKPRKVSRGNCFSRIDSSVDIRFTWNFVSNVF